MHLRKLSIWMITKQIYNIRVFKQMILLFVNTYYFVIQNKIITHTHTHTHILSLKYQLLNVRIAHFVFTIKRFARIYSCKPFVFYQHDLL